MVLKPYVQLRMTLKSVLLRRTAHFLLQKHARMYVMQLPGKSETQNWVTEGNEVTILF